MISDTLEYWYGITPKDLKAMSDTPRTSSMLALILETNGVLNSKTAPQQLVILCRELELELNAANERIRQIERLLEKTKP